MKRPDDDMKIDLSDIFGGELGAQTKPGEGTAQAQEESGSEREAKFQAWMESREKELALKAQELERRLQEINAQQNLETSSPSLDLSAELTQEPEQAAVVPQALPAQPLEEVPAGIEEAVPQGEGSSPESPIDFSAPIAPPFMGAAAAPAPPEASPAEEVPEKKSQPDELKRLQAEHEFLMLYDEFRNIILHELRDLVGEKKTFTMLGRTVEVARGKFPEIFRNANWDSAGNLLEDGSLEGQRIIDNKNSLDPQKAEMVLDTALVALLSLRLQAVEKGLGTGLKNKVRTHMYQWVTERTQKAGRDGKDPSILRRLNGYVSQV